MIASSAAAASDRRGSIDGGGFSRTANIRRRASLLRKRLPNKSSPHLGWFRHAPPAPATRSTSTTIAVRLGGFYSLREAKEVLRATPGAVTGTGPGLSYAQSSLRMKSSPYIGWFRHAPPSRLNLEKRACPAVLQELLDLTSNSVDLHKRKHLKTSESSSLEGFNGRLNKHDLEAFLKTMDEKFAAAAPIDGRLPGGQPLSGDDADTDTNAARDPPPFPPLTWLDQRVSASLRQNEPYMYHPGLERKFGIMTHEESSMSDDASCSTSTTAFAGTADTPSATIGMLNRLAHWFLFPLAHDAAGYAGFADYDDVLHNRVSSGILTFIFPFLSSLLRNILLLEDGSCSSGNVGTSRQGNSDGDIYDRDVDGDSDDESIATSEDAQGDEEASRSFPVDRDGISQCLNVSVSSLAERYYAHEARKELVAAGEDLRVGAASGVGSVEGMPPPSNQQLDYVITQIDIARMVRNASRHLDVESILSLPTVTYRAKKCPPSTSDVATDKNEANAKEDAESADEQRDAQREGASPGGENEGPHEQRRGASDAIGWSWMMVPPDPSDVAARIPSDTESDDTSNDDANEGTGHRREPQNLQSAEEEEEEEAKQGSDDSCVICLEHFVDGDRLRVLPCTHLFHVGCIDKWLSGSYSDEECFTSGCPTCKEHPVRCREEEELAGATREGVEADECGPPSPDGNVPSWAFTRLGDAMASSSSSTISR